MPADTWTRDEIEAVLADFERVGITLTSRTNYPRALQALAEQMERVAELEAETARVQEKRGVALNAAKEALDQRDRAWSSVDSKMATDLDAARTALAESQAGSARLREALEQARAFTVSPAFHPDGDIDAIIGAALATTAGRDALEEMRALRAVAEAAREMATNHSDEDYRCDCMTCDIGRALAALGRPGEPDRMRALEAVAEAARALVTCRIGDDDQTLAARVKDALAALRPAGETQGDGS